MTRPSIPLAWVAGLVVILSACGASQDSGTTAPTSGPVAMPTAPVLTRQAETPTISAPAGVPSAPVSRTPAEPTDVPTATAVPSRTPTPTVTPTPTPVLQQLTDGGCCTQPFWSPDSTHVLFVDRPNPDEPAGIWAVSISNPFRPFLYLNRIALYSDDLGYLVNSDGRTTTIERLPDPATGGSGELWQVPAGGRPISFSPGRKRIAWDVSNDALAVETRVTEVWVANLDGTDPKRVLSLPRGGFVGWISDDVLLVSGRESLTASETIFSAYRLVDGAVTELVRGERLRGPALSRDGRWLAYYEAFGDGPQNGLWVVSTDGSVRVALPSFLFGAYQWRDSQRLFVIPFVPDARYHELWQYDVEDQRALRLTDPAVTPFKIANGDWRVSPDGRRVAFVASADHNIWILTPGE